jgi:hypothetical protein
MQLQTSVGPVVAQDGTQPFLRSGRQGDGIISELHGRYYEQTSRGNVFSVSAMAYTIVATTDISPLPANTGVPIVGIFNPNGSGKNASILYAAFTTTSGTPGGPLIWNVISSPAGITAAGVQPMNQFTFATAGSVVRGLSATAITGSAAGVAMGPMGGPAAVAAGAGNYTVSEEVAGRIIVPQGGFCGLAATAVGTNHVVSAWMVWEEVNP